MEIGKSVEGESSEFERLVTFPCFRFVFEIESLRSSSCQLPGGERGTHPSDGPDFRLSKESDTGYLVWSDRDAKMDIQKN